MFFIFFNELFASAQQKKDAFFAQMLPMALNNYLYQLMKLYILCEVQEYSLSSLWMYFQLYNYVSAFSFTDLVVCFFF